MSKMSKTFRIFTLYSYEFYKSLRLDSLGTNDPVLIAVDNFLENPPRMYVCMFVNIYRYRYIDR